MNSAFQGLLSIFRKEFMHIRRDRTTLVFALVTPMMQLILFGFAVNYDVRHISTMVVDLDRSRESREYIASLEATQYLQITGELQSSEEAVGALRSGAARVVIVVPPDFARKVNTEVRPQVQALIDGSDSQVSGPARQALRMTDPESTPPVDVRVSLLYNPNSATTTYTIPGLIGIILQLVTVTLTSFSLVREREQGTLDQLMVTPVSKAGLVIGKLLPYALLATIEFFFVFAVARVIYGVPMAGSLIVLVPLAILFIAAALSIGMLISASAVNQAQALQASLLTVLPSILLSGYIGPRETLPGPLLLISNVVPVTHFISIARGVMVRGAGIQELWVPASALAAITIVLLVGASKRIGKTLG